MKDFFSITATPSGDPGGTRFSVFCCYKFSQHPAFTALFRQSAAFLQALIFLLKSKLHTFTHCTLRQHQGKIRPCQIGSMLENFGSSLFCSLFSFLLHLFFLPFTQAHSQRLLDHHVATIEAELTDGLCHPILRVRRRRGRGRSTTDQPMARTTAKYTSSSLAKKASDATNATTDAQQTARRALLPPHSAECCCHTGC